MFRSKQKKIRAGSRRAVRSFNIDDDDNDANQVGTNSARTVEIQTSDADEPPSALLVALQHRKAEKRNKKRAKAKNKIGSGGNSNNPVVRSFNLEEADDDDDDQIKRKKKKKRKRGLGFGGGDNALNFDQEDLKDGEMGSLAINTYGKEALEQLKSEQKRQTEPRVALQSTTSSNTESLNDDPKKMSLQNTSHNSTEESFISLDDLGEENDKSGENHDQTKEKEKIFVVDDPQPDESHRWERQIEQRAGIKASSRAPEPSNSKLLSLDELSQNLKRTVETIDRQREELKNSTNRLRADRERTITISKDHQENLKRTGLACEFYQSTRRDLTLWVGALRDLQQKVQPIAVAFREMLQIQTKDFDHEFRAWQDDCVATLYQTHRLDRVLGRQPESTLLTTASNEIVIDEFGRDVGSQFIRDRDLRFKERVEYINRNKHTNVNSSINDDIIMREDHDEEERSKILQEALSAALEDLNQEYTSVIQLKAVFDGWFEAYFDDYQQCFATLSFGDLYAILVQVKLHKSNFFPDVLLSSNDSTRASGTSSSGVSQQSMLEINRCFVDSSNEQEKENRYTDKHKTSKVTTENEGRLARAVEKGVLPMLVKILGDNGEEGNNNPFFLFFSATKSSLISKLIKDIAITPLQQGQNSSIDRSSNSKSLSSNLLQQLQNLVSIAIKKTLEEISIPLLNKDSNKPGCDDDDKNRSSLSLPSEALDCSVKFSRVYLVQILQQALCNMIIHWFPLIDLDTNSYSSSGSQEETGIHYVLNFINDKYLVLLSSIKNVEEISSEPLSSAAHFFKQIWEALNTDSRNIIESPSLMLLTMPLRAAACAYQLN